MQENIDNAFQPFSLPGSFCPVSAAVWLHTQAFPYQAAGKGYSGTSEEIDEDAMISCLVATREGQWGAYAATKEQLERKEQPTYLSPYDQPSLIWDKLDAMCPKDEVSEFTDYGSFWAKVKEAGISIPDSDKMPHRQRVVAVE